MYYLLDSHMPVITLQRHALQDDVMKRDATTIQATNIQKQQTILLKRIQKYWEVQLIFMPGLQAYLASQSSQGDNNLATHPEETPLHLPSALPAVSHKKICSFGLADMEDQLHYAQAVEALANLHAQLQTQIMASQLSNKDASSQRADVCSHALQDQVEACVRMCQAQYNVAHSAILSLCSPGDWENSLAVLKPKDVRGMSERVMTAEDEAEHDHTWQMAGWNGDDDAEGVTSAPIVAFNTQLALGEGRQMLLWIWY